jgi:hypothetical protein
MASRHSVLRHQLVSGNLKPRTVRTGSDRRGLPVVLAGAVRLRNGPRMTRRLRSAGIPWVTPATDPDVRMR